MTPSPGMPRLSAYRHPSTLTTLGLAGALLFLGGLASMYEAHLRVVYEHRLALSLTEWAAHGTGAFLVEPVALFVVLFVAARRFDSPPDVLSILPGMVVAVVPGTLLGQVVGAVLFPTGPTPLSLLHLVRRALRLTAALEPPVIRIWRFALELVVRDLLTAVAALALGMVSRE